MRVRLESLSVLADSFCDSIGLLDDYYIEILL